MDPDGEDGLGAGFACFGVGGEDLVAGLDFGDGLVVPSATSTWVSPLKLQNALRHGDLTIRTAIGLSFEAKKIIFSHFSGLTGVSPMASQAQPEISPIAKQR